MCAMSVDNIREIIKRELPILVSEDEELRELIRRLYQNEFSNRAEVNDRFDRILAELQKDREEQARKWEENKLELQKDREENKQEFNRVHEEIMALAKKQERGIGALGARWGLQSESTFRNALAGILEGSFGVEVINVTEYDDEGIVFGQPDQVELDVIIKNGVLILCELKSSMSKSDMVIFDRKVQFYEKKHGRKASRKLVISPMIDQRALAVAKKAGIECYSDSLDVETL